MSGSRNRANSGAEGDSGGGPNWQERLAHSSSDNHKDLLGQKFLTSKNRIMIARDDVGPGPLGWHSVLAQAREAALGDRGATGRRPRKLSGAYSARDGGYLATSSNPAESSTAGLLVIPIPTPSGELTALVRDYRHHLGDEGKQSIHWRAIDDPRLCDDIYRQQRSPELIAADQKTVAVFLRRIAHSGMHQLDFNDEYLLLIKHLGIPVRDLPILVFAAPSPVYVLAQLPLSIELFESERAKRDLGNFLLEEFAQEKLLKFAQHGQFTRESMVALQRHLIALEARVSALVEIQQSKLRQLFRKRGKAPRSALVPYTFVQGSGRRRTSVTREEYESLLQYCPRYDFIFNGITRACYKRARKGGRHERSQLTPAEFGHLQACITCGGLYKAVKPGEPDGPDYALTAIRQFNYARQKADIAKEHDTFTMFHTRRGRTADQRRFEFRPPKGVTWLLIEDPMI